MNNYKTVFYDVLCLTAELAIYVYTVYVVVAVVS